MEQVGAFQVLRGDGSDLQGLNGVLVAFSPEREDPGNMVVPRRDIPKVIGGVGASRREGSGGPLCDGLQQDRP